jgi:long-chain fatty acid transport protein
MLFSREGLGYWSRVLTDREDGIDAEIGFGHRFNSRWSGSVAIGFSSEGDDSLVSPIGPNNRSRYVSVGARYNVTDRTAVSGGVRLTALGNAVAAPGDIGVARFENNMSATLGIHVAYRY